MSNPFSAEGTWYKGNLHTHTTNSDGRKSPQEGIDLYAAAGYDFLSLTDHRCLTAPDGLDPRGMALIPGVELNGGRGELGQQVHVVALQPALLPELSEVASIAEVVSLTAQASRVCFIAHPSWSSLLSHDLLDCHAAVGVEVYNTGCHREMGRGESTVQWDGLLARGYRLGAFAVDDAHFRFNDACGGWTWVRARELTAEALVEAIEAGHYYASTGPELLDVQRRDNELYVRCSPCREIALVDPRPGRGTSSFQCGHERGLLTEFVFRWEGAPAYRVECTDAEGYKAWSSPFYEEQ